MLNGSIGQSLCRLPNRRECPAPRLDPEPGMMRVFVPHDEPQGGGWEGGVGGMALPPTHDHTRPSLRVVSHNPRLTRSTTLPGRQERPCSRIGGPDHEQPTPCYPRRRGSPLPASPLRLL